jgi:hypothetical protein
MSGSSRSRRSLILLAVAALAALPLALVPAQTASAVTCGTSASDHFGRYHTDTDGRVAGIRAPIKLRRDSALCSSSNAFTANYISIEDDNSGSVDFGQIDQIGWDDGAYNVPNGLSSPYCKFWAIGLGQPHDYSCSISDSTYTYFMVRIDAAATPDIIHIYDCGQSSGYTSCTLKGQENAPDKARSTVTAETNFPGQIHTLGSGGNPVNYGTSAFPIEQKNDTSSSWSSGVSMENALADQAGISNYHMAWDGTSKILSTWDDRN